MVLRKEEVVLVYITLTKNNKFRVFLDAFTQGTVRRTCVVLRIAHTNIGDDEGTVVGDPVFIIYLDATTVGEQPSELDTRITLSGAWKDRRFG